MSKTVFRGWWQDNLNRSSLMQKPFAIKRFGISAFESTGINTTYASNNKSIENGRRNVFMTKSPQKNMPDVGIELGAACMPSELASDRATAPAGLLWCKSFLLSKDLEFWLSNLQASTPPVPRTTKALIWLHRCAGWSVSFLIIFGHKKASSCILLQNQECVRK